LIYLSLFIMSFLSDWNYHQEIIRNHGVRLGGVREFNALLILYPTAILFILISSANVLRKENNKFYLWLIALIIVPLIVYSNLF
jgi:hypothetical protein